MYSHRQVGAGSDCNAFVLHKFMGIADMLIETLAALSGEYEWHPGHMRLQPFIIPVFFIRE
jgi:hypothetical protein